MPFTSAFISARPAPVPPDWALVRRLVTVALPFLAGVALGAVAFRAPPPSCPNVPLAAALTMDPLVIRVQRSGLYFLEDGAAAYRAHVGLPMEVAP